ncbi:MAG: MATE family efflux transporter [Lachnospiraceae bacterium]|nr:MATE family efflux transporter [Lachnospiraceae bacterium]
MAKAAKVGLVKDRSFYKSFFSMLVVLVLQNVITISVNLADNIMLGAYAEVSLSGVAAVNQVQFVFQQILTGIGEGAIIIGTQYFGKRQMEPVKRVGAIAMRFALAVAVILFIVVSLIPERIVGIFTTDAAIIAQGVEYIRIIRFTYIMFAVTQILLAILRSTGVVKIALALSVSTLIVNCCINYTLIYGHFGAPRLGVTGAAIGTLTARAIELIILLVFIVFKEKNLHLRLKDVVIRDRSLTGTYFKVTIPVLIVSSLWGLNNATQNAILGHMTARAIAANSVASTMFMLVKSMAIGAAATASFFIGKTIGEGDMDKLKSIAKTLQVLFVCIGIFSGIVLFLIRIPILSLYKLEPETRVMANRFLMVLSVTVATMSYQMPTNSGIIKGGGDTRYMMIMDLVSIWGIVIPLSFIMAFVVKASPLVVVCCLNADQVFKCVPAFIKCNYGHWAKKLTKA